MDDDIEIVKRKEVRDSCCQAYLTSKGRCFDCPEQPEHEDEW